MKKIKILSIVLAVLLLVNSTMLVNAEEIITGTCGDSATWSWSSSTQTLTIAGTGSVNSASWEENSEITYGTVIIEEGITEIGAKIFYNDQQLHTVSLPSTLKTIGNKAFDYCLKLNSIDLTGVESIGQGAFSNCDSLTTVTIPSSVTSMGISCFNNCNKLTSVNWQASLKQIPSNTFEECKLLATVNLVEGIERIEASAFTKCTSLTKIELPNSLTFMNGNCFTYTGLEEIYIPKNVTYISGLVHNYSLSSINVDPENSSYSSIDGVLFDKDVKKLICYPSGKVADSYTVPDTVTTIVGSAFASCYTNTVILPKNVAEIKNYSFADYNKSALERICVLNPNCNIYDSDRTFYTSATIYGIYNSTSQVHAEAYGHAFVPICVDGSENHLYSSTSTATCTADGIKTYTCTNCPYNYSEDAIATGHNYKSTTVESTCTVAGSITYVCSNCSHTYSDAIAVKGHVYKTSIKEGSCKSPGSITYTCDICGDSYSEETNALGHTYDSKTVKPNCTDKGYTEYICSLCGYSYRGQETDALGHTLVRTVVSESTQDTQGVAQYKCSVCGIVVNSELLDKLPIENKFVDLQTTYSGINIVCGLGCAKFSLNVDKNLDGYEVYLLNNKTLIYSVANEFNISKNYCILSNLPDNTICYIKAVGYKMQDNKKIYTNESDTIIFKTK